MTRAHGKTEAWMARTSTTNSSSKAGAGGIAPGDMVLEGLEKDARETKKGLWTDLHPVLPWEWRKARRDQAPDLSDLVPLDTQT